MSCFWLMMFQLWDLQPNFIADWVDSGADGPSTGVGLPERLAIGGLASEKTPRGPMVPQQVLLSFNAFFIILGVVGMAWLTRRMRTLTAMLIGMMLATVGVLVAGWTQSAWMLVAGILFFSLGEMMTGPKKSEYLALDRPAGQEGTVPGLREHPRGRGRVPRLVDCRAWSMAASARRPCWPCVISPRRRPSAQARTGTATWRRWKQRSA